MRSKESKPDQLINKKKFEIQNYIVYIFFFVVLIFFSFTIGNKGFLTITNTFSIFRSTAMIVVMATAMTFIVASGEIDLSVGSTAALSSYVAALLMREGFNIFIAVVVALAAGFLVGAVNGFLITRVGIPAFLCTLGMQQLVRGVDMWITYTHPVAIANPGFNNFFGYGNLGPLPSLLVWSVSITILGYIVFKYTTFGRQVIATGGNRLASEYSGVNTKKIRFLTFCLSGTSAALAGLLYAGMMRTARYTFGSGAELSALAAVFIGGTSIAGGGGTIIGTFVGALLIGTINNGIIILGLDVSQQMMVAGAIIILAVAFGNKDKNK